jgi:hypothetical protein
MQFLVRLQLNLIWLLLGPAALVRRLRRRGPHWHEASRQP